jgi:hypothetical protein
MMCLKNGVDMQVYLKNPLLEGVLDIRFNSARLEDFDVAGFNFNNAVSRGDKTGIDA